MWRRSVVGRVEAPWGIRAFQAGRLVQTAGEMPEFTSSTVVILLASILGVLLLIFIALLGISRNLAVMVRRQAEPQSREEATTGTPSAAETSAGGAFETFLREDPARRKLAKGEQFAAYRKWRQENGLNWTNS